MPTYPYRRPCVTVDLFIIGSMDGVDQLLLIRRANEPYAGRWALPGGFVDVGDAEGAQGEDLMEAAARELREETGLADVTLWQVAAVGTPDRDPRHRTITVLYGGELRGPLPTPRGGDDANDARWFPLAQVLEGEPPLAFDHLPLVRIALGQVTPR
ncbi:MAG: NUDIX hydrolase [Myxococcota bacterium]|nr:NUDIX hydrolase [Myxococcota bacterium]